MNFDGFGRKLSEKISLNIGRAKKVFCLLNQDTDYRIAIVDYFSLAAAIIRDGHMPDMNFSTWNHACSKVHEILELQEHIRIILFNISRPSVKSMPQMLCWNFPRPMLMQCCIYNTPPRTPRISRLKSQIMKPTFLS